MPAAFVAFGQTWKDLHPDWEMREWGDELPALVNHDLYIRATELCPGFEGQLRSDVARLEILYQYGGVYVDCDFEAARPIDGLLEGVGCFAAWERQDQVVNNAILGCEPGHPFIERLIAELPASVLGNPGKRPSKVSGPWFVTAEYRKHPGELTVFPEKWFYPYRCDQLHRARERFPEAYAIHHWNNQRRLRRKPL